MCSVVGILGQAPVNQSIYEAMTVMQHRGQDAAGILTSDGRRVYERKDSGLVRDVFQMHHMEKLIGHSGIGHTRYPTAGCDSKEEAQPFYVNSPFGLALGHNGNLTNADELREDVFRTDLRQLNTTSDSEILLNVLAHELHESVGRGRIRLTPDDIFDAVSRVYERCQGAYAVTGLIVGFGMFAFRDPHGIRPLVWGSRRSPSDTQTTCARMQTEHMVASESVALDVLGFKLQRDLLPGEAIFIDLEGQAHTRVCARDTRTMPCLFEYVYLARPDSIIDNISVYKTRLRLGEYLGQKISRDWPQHDIDVVIPVPDTSRTAAAEVANILKLKYREGFIKNRYIGRTFIMPGQEERRRSVRQKLNAIDLEFRNKNVLLVDDSIVRGTTSKQIVQMARDAGARQVYFASAAPPVKYPNVYGIDMPATAELVAHGRTIEEICAEIGADRLIYQELKDLTLAAQEGNPNITKFEDSCFSGNYVTDDITKDYLKQLEIFRSDAERERRRTPSATSDAA